MYYYSSVAGMMRLVGAITSSSGSITLDSILGLPASTPFKVVVDPGSPSEEILRVTAVAGSTLTVTRGWDGTVPMAHPSAAEVRHAVTAEDLRLSREHEAATVAHGLASAFVGTSDSQALTNKTFQASATETPLTLRQAGSSTADLLQSMTAGGSVRAAIGTLGVYLKSAAANVIELLNGDGSAASGFLARFTPGGTTVDGARFMMPASSTAKAVQVNLNGVETARIEADGDASFKAVSATSVASSGAISGTTLSATNITASGTLTATGAITGSSTLTVPGNVQGGGLVSTGDAQIADDLSADVGTFNGLVVNSLINAPGLRARGGEGVAGSGAGVAPTAGTPLDFRFFSAVITTNASGGFGYTFPGPAFPNGTVTVVCGSGDTNVGQAWVRVISAQVSKSGFGGQVYADNGSPVNTQPVRINGFAVGW